MIFNKAGRNWLLQICCLLIIVPSFAQVPSSIRTKYNFNHDGVAGNDAQAKGKLSIIEAEIYSKAKS